MNSLSHCLDLCSEAKVFLVKGPQRIGSIYMKAVYKQYSDATFRTEVMKPDWLGFLGPLMMAEEGDTLVVHLKNTASRPYSLHPHGLHYSKRNEGEEWTPRLRNPAKFFYCNDRTCLEPNSVKCCLASGNIFKSWD